MSLSYWGLLWPPYLKFNLPIFPILLPCFLFSKHLSPLMYCIFYIFCISSSPSQPCLKWSLQEDGDFCLFCSLLSPCCLEQCLAPSRNSRNMCQMSKRFALCLFSSAHPFRLSYRSYFILSGMLASYVSVSFLSCSKAESGTLPETGA